MAASAFEERYAQLNADQKRAVDAIEGAVLVVAGPGSGKTEILALRVARILQQTDAGPGSILCLTFTDSAASTMRARLASLIGAEAYRVQIGTFHAFAQLVAQQHPAYFASGAELVPAEAMEQRELVAEAIRALPLRDPLRSEHPSEGLTYLKSAVARITDLKKAGIGPDALEEALAHNAALISQIEAHLGAFAETVGMKRLASYAAAAEAIRGIPRAPFPLVAFPDLASVMARSLEGAIMDAEAVGKATPLSAWKTEHLAKDGDARVLKARQHQAKLESLTHVYRRYQELLRERGLRDFDDLIVDLISALKANPDLRADLQEEYQYVLVDEFQDTNGAQAELLALLADSPVAAGNPNLMVVGDDDQAIYRFHGAGLEHLLGFAERYPQATVVTMTTNYRSHQDILDLARAHIAAARERLEGRLPGLSKQLVQGGKQAASEIAAIRAPSRDQEREAIAALVAQRIASGANPSEIAIIGRRNRDLEAIAPYLAERSVRVSYERQRDALADAHIVELIETARVASAITEGDASLADPLLPRVLAFPFWNVPRLQLWLLARQAHDQKKPWLDLMLAHDEPGIKAAAELLVEIGSRAAQAPADQLVDELVGTCPTPEGRQSPYRAYHFGPEARTERPEQLLMLVGALRSVLAAFRESRRGEASLLADLVRFADLRRAHDEPIPTRIEPTGNAVRLLTAHKAKGMEFETVILLHGATDVWHGAGRGSLIAFPENLPLAPAGDSLDDQLRGLYVAITRAKAHLYIATSPPDSSRGSEPLPLVEHLPDVALAYEPLPREQLSWAARVEHPTGGERDALLPLVADFQLTPTQLNDFLDVVHGGPQAFFERYVLRFPQHASAEMRFGNAVHGILERVAIEAHAGKALPDEDALPQMVEAALAQNGFHGEDLARHAALGATALSAYCAQRGDELRRATHVEVSFAKDRIMLGAARITGKADVIREDEDGLVIIDYKTGRASSDWDEKGKAPQRAANRRQLLFYAILAQQSPRFAGKSIKEAKLSFVVPDNEGAIRDLVLEPEAGEVDRVARLIQAVHARVTRLDFPDVSSYSKDLKGIEAFEETLLTDQAGKA